MSEFDNDRALRRRLAAPVLQAPVEGDVVDRSALVGRALNRAGDNALSQIPAYSGLVNKYMGDEAAAQADFQEFDRLQRRAREAYEIQSLDDVEAAGGKVSDYGKFALGEAINFLPDIVTTGVPALLTGSLAGIAAAAAKGTASKIAKEAAEELTEEAVQKAARGELKDVANAAAFKRQDDLIAQLEKEGGKLDSATTENVLSEMQKAGSDAVRNRLIEDRLAQSARGVQEAMDRGQRFGQFVGATAAQGVGLSRESVDVVRDQDAEAAGSVLATDMLAGAIGAAPAMRLLGRYGVKAPTLPPPELRTLVPRVAKEFAAQGASESATELAQTATQLWGHKQVMDSIDLLGPQAFDQYTSALIGGLLAGGSIGAGAEGFRGVGSGLAKMLGYTRNTAKDALKRLDARLRGGGRPGGTDPNAPTPSPVNPGEAAGASVGGVGAPVPAAAAAPSPGVAPSPAPASAPSPSAEVVNNFKELRAQLGENDPTPSTMYSRGEEEYETEIDQWIAESQGALSSLLSEGMQQSPRELPGEFESSIQRLAMAYVDPDWSGFSDRNTAQGAARALEKLLVPTSDLTATDEAYLQLLTSTNAIDPEMVRKFAMLGPALRGIDEFFERSTAGEELRKQADAMQPPSDELMGVINDAGRKSQYAELELEAKGEAEREALARLGLTLRTPDMDEASDTPEGVRALRQQAYGSEDPALGRIEMLKAAEARLAEMRQQGMQGDDLIGALEEVRQLRTQARIDLLGSDVGERGQRYPFGSNVIFELPNASGDQKKAFAAKMRQPQFLMIDEGTAPAGARTAINLQNLVTQQRVRTPNISAREALIRGLSNLLDLGVKFDVKQLRPFAVGTDRISPADVAAIKAQPPTRRFEPSTAPAPETPFNSTKAKAKWVADRALQIAQAAGRSTPIPADRTAAVNELNARSAEQFSSSMAAMNMSKAKEVSGKDPAEDQIVLNNRQGPRAAPKGRALIERDGQMSIIPEDAPLSVTPSNKVLPAAARSDEIDMSSPESQAERARVKAQLVSELRDFVEGMDKRGVDLPWRTEKAMQVLQRGWTLGDDQLADIVSTVAFYAKKPETIRTLALRVNQYFDGVQSRAAERALAAVSGTTTYRPISTDNLLAKPLNEVQLREQREKLAAERAKTAAKQRADDAAKRNEAARKLQAERDVVRRAEAALKAARDAEEQLRLEQKMVDALTRAMGIPSVRLEALERTSRDYGHYNVDKDDRPVIRIHPRLKGRERFSVIAHELGHHVIATEVMRAYGHTSYLEALGLIAGTDPAAAARFARMLKGANPKLYAAIKADYDKWRKANGKGTFVSVKATKVTRSMAKMVSRFYKARGRTSVDISQGSEDHREYLFDFNEYIADGISRAIEGNSTAQGIVGQFFKRLADQLRRLYNAIVKNNPEWRAPPSIESYVNGLFDKRRNTVADVLQQPVSNSQAKIAVEAAAAVAVAAAPVTAPTPAKRTKRKKKSPNEAPTAEAPAPTAEAPAPATEAPAPAPAPAKRAKKGAKKGANTAPATEAPATEAPATEAPAAESPAPTPATEAAQPPNDVPPPPPGSTPPPPPPGDMPPPPSLPNGGIHAIAKYVARVMPPDTRLLIEEAINRGGNTFQKLFAVNANPVGSRALQALKQRFAADPEAARLMDTEAKGMEYRIAGLLIMYSEQGNVGAPNVRELIRSWHDQMWELIGRVGDDALVVQALDDALVGHINAAKEAGELYSPRDRVMAKNKARNRTLLALNDYYDKTMGVLSRYWTGRQDRVDSFGVPALRQVMALIHRKAGATDRMDGLIEDKVQKSYALIEKYREITGKLTDAQRDKLRDVLQGQSDAETGDAAVDGARVAMRGFFETMRAYAKSRGTDIPFMDKFYPVRLVLDDDIKREQFRQLMSDEKFFDAMKEAMGKKDGDKVTQAALVADMERYLTEPVDWQAVAQNTGGVPNFKSIRSRLAQFVYDLGTPEQVSLFKKLQNPDMDAVVGEYILSLVNRAEFAYRFGDDGSRLDRLYIKALDQGATPDQLKYVQDVVRSSIGLYALDGSPLLSKISPQLGAIFNKQGVKEASDLMLAYQNWRNLPLAVLSSATEIFGPSIRSGGDLRVAWAGLKTTIKTLYNGKTREQLTQMLKDMGYSQDFAIGENQQSMFGGSEDSKLARKLNDLLFSVNGLTRWTTATRFGSLVAAHQFLIKHADGKASANANSARYLEELNLREGDVLLVPGPNGPRLYLASDADLQTASKEEIERDARVKRALIRFVDEAVPRPNVAQTPLYYSDPAMQFVVQYKAVLYAVYQQYYKRILKEMANGNIAPLMPALFMAATAGVAELLRETIQTAGEGDPRRADWDWTDYAMLGAERVALVPPSITLQSDLIQDFQMRHAEDIFLGSSQLGPAVKQAMQFQSAAAGDRPAADVAESALPASALWKKWINPTEW